jgi:hypothetical protein
VWSPETLKLCLGDPDVSRSWGVPLGRSQKPACESNHHKGHWMLSGGGRRSKVKLDLYHFCITTEELSCQWVEQMQTEALWNWVQERQNTLSSNVESMVLVIMKKVAVPECIWGAGSECTEEKEIHLIPFQCRLNTF